MLLTKPLVCSFISVLLTVFATSALCQKASLIGKVVDDRTSEPVPFANVYFNNTSVGTSADANGNFQMMEVPIELSDLIISSVGFKTVNATINLSEKKPTQIEIRMQPNVTELASVVVRAKHDKNRAKLLKLFVAYFLGRTENSHFTKVLNPEVLDLQYDSLTQKLNASAEAPLELENLALGYHISILLERFEGSEDHYSITSKMFFKQLPAKNYLQKLQWEKNRLETFEGSPRHFMLSVIKGNLCEHGFTVKKYTKTKADFSKDDITTEVTEKDLIVANELGAFQMLTKGVYQIEYAKTGTSAILNQSSKSWIEVHDSLLNVRANGIIKLPAKFWFLGDFERSRMADQLPIDFDFFDEFEKLRRKTILKDGGIFGVVIDEQARPVKDVRVFVNNGLTKTITNALGQFEFNSLPSGEYPLVFAKKGMKLSAAIAEVDSSTMRELLIILKQSKISTAGFAPILKQDIGKINRHMAPESKKYRISLLNPQDLVYKPDTNGAMHLQAIDPLIFSSSELGYQWTYYFDSLTYRNKKLTGTAYVQHDTLRASTREEREKWKLNRARIYEVSANRFFSWLIDGISLPGEVEVTDTSQKKLKNEILSISYDSLLDFKKGRYWLKLNNTTQVKFAKKTGGKSNGGRLKLYPRASRIAISKSGAFDGDKLNVSSNANHQLRLIPLDYALQHERTLRSSKVNLVERIYVHTDKLWYHPGQKIWLKGYITSETSTNTQSLSGVLYIDLFNSNGGLVSNLILPIENGKAVGDANFSQSLPLGPYTLRAYTSYSAQLGYFHYQTIPVLPVHESIDTDTINTTQSHQDLSCELIKNSWFYKSGDSAKVVLKLTDAGKPAAGEFSVSVNKQIGKINTEAATILKLNGRADKNFQLGTTHLAPERGLTHKIKIIDGKQNHTYMLTAIAKMEAIKSEIKGNIGSFVLNFTDTTSVLIKATDSDGRGMKTEILEREIPTRVLPNPLPYKLLKGKATGSTNTTIATIAYDSAKLLEEVTIKAKRISEQKENLPTDVFLSGIVTTLSVADMEAIKNAGSENFYQTLIARIPRLVSPFILLGDQPYQFFLDGMPLKDFDDLQPNLITRIDHQVTPFNVVAFYTHKTVPAKGGSPDLFQLRGFSKSTDFQQTKLASEANLETLYWNPTVYVQNGQSSFRFVTLPRTSGKYQIVIEGITDNNKAFRIVDFITVH